ncbi:Response regulator receiver protein (modular protein) [Verrucomicrobia bacterium]|nr:Response regulator receiver protein (modular protein) [Verrucomicrobiota bacterium]
MRNRRCQILVAEDDDNDALLLTRAFEKSGLEHSISRVADGQEAVDYLAGMTPFLDRTLFPLPDLLLLDLKMPRMGGFEVLAWLGNRPDLQLLPVVVLSSSSLPEDIAKARELGARDYKVKPVEFADLVRLVQHLHSCYLGPEPEFALPTPSLIGSSDAPSPKFNGG